MSLKITGITISVEFGDMEYSKGTKSFASLHGRCPEGEEIPVENAADAINAGLDMYLAAWETMMVARCAMKTITGEELKELIPAVKERAKRLKALLPTL